MPTCTYTIYSPSLYMKITDQGVCIFVGSKYLQHLYTFENIKYIHTYIYMLILHCMPVYACACVLVLVIVGSIAFHMVANTIKIL